MPDWDNTESRESDEDAAWRDLVARFEEPVTTTGPAPWPERENVSGSRPQASREAGADGADRAYEAGDAQGELGAGPDQGPAGAPGDSGGQGVEGTRGFDDEGVLGAFGADGTPGAFDTDGLAGKHEPDVIQAARRGRRVPAHGTRARRVRARKAPPLVPDDEEHYIPPAPPPLPRLDPIAKGAWLALFGGPGYLVVTTAAGWSVSGIAAFLAVAAFVTGFAILVLRMNEPGPGGPDDGDDGAVV